MDSSSFHSVPISGSSPPAPGDQRKRAVTDPAIVLNQDVPRPIPLDSELSPFWDSGDSYPTVVFTEIQKQVEEQKGFRLDVISTVSARGDGGGGFTEPNTTDTKSPQTLDDSEYLHNTNELKAAEEILFGSILPHNHLARNGSLFKETITSAKTEPPPHRPNLPISPHKKFFQIKRPLTACNIVLILAVSVLILFFVPTTVYLATGKENKIISYFQSGNRTDLLLRLNEDYGLKLVQSQSQISVVQSPEVPSHFNGSEESIQESKKKRISNNSQKPGAHLGGMNTFAGISLNFKHDTEIKQLMEQATLYGPIFYGMAYSPMNGMEPECGFTARDAQLDMALLSTVTTRVRNYGMQCKQSRFILDAIESLGLNMTLSMGVWIGSDEEINNQQMNEMKYVLLHYPRKLFENVFIGNEVLFRRDQTTTGLSNYIKEAKSFANNIGYADLKFGTSEIGSLVNEELLRTCDIIGTNVHPFFGGDIVENGSEWTFNFIKHQIEPHNKFGTEIVITEVGWPFKGGSFKSSVASTRNFEYFLHDWCCKAYDNNYGWYYFEAFDEEWKRVFYEGNNRWETEWGVFNADRSMKIKSLSPHC